MKLLNRIFAVVLAVLMLSVCAVAEEVEYIEVATWTAADGAMAMDVPADWVEMDPETIAALIKDMVESGMLDEANLEASTEQMILQMESFYAFFYEPNFIDSLNIIASPANGMDIIAGFDALKPTLEAQLTQNGVEVQSIEAVAIGEHNVIVTVASMLGVEQMQVMIQDPACQNLYTFTFTGDAIPYVELIVSSIAFA